MNTINITDNRPNILHYLNLKLQELEIFENMHKELDKLRKEYAILCRKKKSKNTSVHLAAINASFQKEQELENYEMQERTRATNLLKWDGVYTCYDNKGNEHSTYEIKTQNDINIIRSLVKQHSI